jgi:hypothetical protein
MAQAGILAVPDHARLEFPSLRSFYMSPGPYTDELYPNFNPFIETISELEEWSQSFRKSRNQPCLADLYPLICAAKESNQP